MDASLDNNVIEYQRAVRGRAAETLRDLRRHTLEDQPVLPPSRRRVTTTSDQSTMWRSSRNTEHCDYTYVAAVDKLRTMLQKHDPGEPKVVQFGASLPLSPNRMTSYSSAPSPMQPLRGPTMPRGEIPGPTDTVSLMQHQSSLLVQTEAEMRYCKDELHALKMKVIELVEENRLLHEEVKRSTVQEIINEGIEVSGISESPSAWNRPFTSSSPSDPKRQMTGQDYGRWQVEMERINALHTAKTTRMEVQLTHTREELQTSQKEIDELKGKLRMKNSLLSADPDADINLAAGLCIKCAQNEAVLAPSSGGTMRESLEKVSRERDELVTELTGLRARYGDLKMREEDAYQQVKRSVEMVEQAQLEQTQALVQREQLKDELVNMQLRMEEHAEQMQKTMTGERELVRKETAAERDELNTKRKELTEQLVESQTQLDRVTRDKIAVMSELHCIKGQIDSVDMDYGKATDSMKMSMTHATIERNAAMHEMKKLHKKAHSMEKELEQERSRLRTEGENLRRRLTQAERSLIEAKEQCVHLANNNQELERELHLAKLAKETVELTRGDDLKNILHRSEQREQQLNSMIETLEARHRQAIRELEEMLTSQTCLVQKLQEECRLLATQLEDVTMKYRRDNKHLKSQNVQIKTRQDRAVRQLRELQDQNTQHGLLQEKMRERLRQLDAHAYKSGQQILELLNKESGLMKERQVLAREVEFLRTQLTRNGADTNVLCSSHTVAVNDILGNICNEMVTVAGGDDTDAILERRAEKSRNMLRNELVKLKLSYEDRKDKATVDGDVSPERG